MTYDPTVDAMSPASQVPPTRRTRVKSAAKGWVQAVGVLVLIAAPAELARFKRRYSRRGGV